MKDTMVENRLHSEVQRLKQWTDRNDPDIYPYYGDFLKAVQELLRLPQLSAEQISLLVEALALDDESESIQDLLRELPDTARLLMSAAVAYPDYRARWQAGVLAGEVGSKDIVARYLNDAHEYIRRRTILAARIRFPALAESVALPWLDSYEYERMVALDTLHAVESSHYHKSVSKLARDSSSVVQMQLKRLTEA